MTTPTVRGTLKEILAEFRIPSPVDSRPVPLDPDFRNALEDHLMGHMAKTMVGRDQTTEAPYTEALDYVFQLAQEFNVPKERRPARGDHRLHLAHSGSMEATEWAKLELLNQLVRAQEYGAAVLYLARMAMDALQTPDTLEGILAALAKGDISPDRALALIGDLR